MQLTSRVISKEFQLQKEVFIAQLNISIHPNSIHPIKENIFSIIFFKIFARLNWFFIQQIPETRLWNEVSSLRFVRFQDPWSDSDSHSSKNIGKGRRNFARKMGRFDSRGRMKAFIIRRVTEMRCRCTVTGADYFNHRGITVAFTCPNE